jgi:lipopolysaccharide transport system ATP-binding protein
MSTPIIEVNQVSKFYRRQQYAPSFRHDGIRLVKRILRLSRRGEWEQPPFWALKDINLSIQPGEAVGIVGRNGSGKTTLLRLLSNVTEPTQGTIAVRGRYTSLIGLGAGFDIQRSGYENIFLNAAIYGVSSQQVKAILPEIIAFSELDEFLQTPIKLYSSGMLARLGFSIAVHVFPRIIFLDEILAVGDYGFQEKCYQRMLQMKADGCTLLFVSHSNAAVEKLCERTIWLHQGQIMMDDVTPPVIEAYTRFLFESPG